MSPRRPTRLAHIPYVGLYRYFLTICVEKRRPVFTSGTAASEVVAQFLRCAAAGDFDVLAYCVMPDHFHALVEARSDQADLRSFVHRFKLMSAHAWRRHSSGRLWQAGYYDRVLRSDEAVDSVARYIVANPIRAGLVDDIETYPWVSSTV